MGSDRPIGGRDYPRTYQEFRSWFGDDGACIDYLGQLRWPGGFVCPKCGAGRSWRTAKRQWVCAQCAQRTSAMAGTIFHRSHTPISTWFAAAWFVTSQKNGVSAVGLQHALGFGSYETAWAWMHKLRRAMVRPERDLLAGQVMASLAPHFGPVMGSLSFASTRISIGAWLFLMKGSLARRL